MERLHREIIPQPIVHGLGWHILGIEYFENG